MHEHVLLFDGDCALCNWTIQFVLKNDVSKKFVFAPIQSGTGRKILKDNGIENPSMDTFYYLKEGKLYTESSGALRVASSLRFPYNTLCMFLVIPKFIRDFCYRFVATHRFRWFGQAQSCMLSTPEIQKRFID